MCLIIHVRLVDHRHVSFMMLKAGLMMQTDSCKVAQIMRLFYYLPSYISLYILDTMFRLKILQDPTTVFIPLGFKEKENREGTLRF